MKKDNKELLVLLFRVRMMKILRLFFSEFQINSVLYRIKKKEKPDLHNPKSFSEKLQYLKMYYDNPMISVCIDKYNVNKYLKLKGYEDIIKKVYAVYRDPDEINLDDLPEKCFIQLNHMSKFNYILDKSKPEEIEHIKKIYKKLIRYNHYWLLLERPYLHLKPCIICCELLQEPGHQGLTDYKFYCFDGKVKYFMISHGEFTHETKNAKFDLEWNNLDDQFKGKTVLNITKEDAPPNFDYMVQIARDLSQGFPHVRVDLYNVEGRVYFGELTFFSSGGFVNVHSLEMDRKIAEWIDLDKYKNDMRRN